MTSQTAPPPAPEFADRVADPGEHAEVLLTNDLIKIYAGRPVVNGVKLTVNQGEIVGLLGKNGAGKTTSFYLIVGLVRPNRGRVIFSGTDVTDYPMYKRARLGMGYLPQEESIFRKMTVEQNILAILETMPLSKQERRHRCDELLHQFGIERIAKNTALTLSGGEKRRLTIARSLVSRPKLLMLDEPFSGVDPIAVEDLQVEVKRLKDEFRKSVLITDHNVAQTLRVCDRALIISDGRVQFEGEPKAVINDPGVRSAYLGNTFRGDEFG
jgi:lipopolysaccharide export system ATP-binding protein